MNLIQLNNEVHSGGTQDYTDKAKNNYLVFDLECGKSDDYLDYFESKIGEFVPPEYKPDKRLKNPDKIQEHKDGHAEVIEEAKKAHEQSKVDELANFESKCALKATTCKILTITCYAKGEIIVQEVKDEAQSIEQFWCLFSQYPKVIGHNILGYDLPILLRKSMKYGIKPTWKPDKWDKKIYDTMEEFAVGVWKDYYSLDHLCKFFGIPGKTSDGSKFEGLYLNADTKQKALDYARDDVDKTNQVYRKMVGL